MSMSVGGGGRDGSGRFSARGEINVTPLIDIVLVLLIVFMVMTPVMLKQLVAKIPEEDRQSDNTPQPPGDDPIIVSLGADGVINLGSQPIAVEALAGAVGERLSHDRQKVVFFRIDDRANYGRAIKLMDLCKGAGAATLGIVTNK